jgi:fatty acid synthase subunit alpha
VQVITSARLALDMGMPIHAIIAWVGTASDKVGRSVPAAGKGILVNAREAPSKHPSPLLDLSYRRRRMTIRMQQIQANLDAELELLREDEAATDGSENALEQLHLRAEDAKKDAARQTKEAIKALGNEFWHGNQHIAPLRGALAVWGLTVDDLDFASFHGTSTKNNDINETDVIQTQLSHLGRNDGNPILGIFQKYLTGHAKGGAGAWMLNGCLQVLDSGLVPGNRNADNIDAKLRENELIVFPNRTIRTPGVRAFSISSFGFGQKGAQAIGVHPRYLFAAIAKDEYDGYAHRRRQRHRRAARFFHKAMATNTMFVAKTDAPYRNDQEKKVLLNAAARLQHQGGGYDDGKLAR